MSEPGGNHLGRDVGLLADHEIRVLPGRLEELVVHRADGIVVLPDDAVEGAAALPDVAMKAADETHVGLDVQEELHVETAADLGIPEREDALEQEPSDRADALDLIRAPARLVVVDRHRDRLAVPEPRQVIAQEIPVEGIGVVEVVLAVDLQMGRRRGKVVGILLEERDALRETIALSLMASDPSQDFLGEGRFARTGSAGDPNEKHH